MTPLQSVALVAAALAVLYLVSVAGVLIARAVATGGRRDDAIEHNDARSTSRFTIPVSIVVPVGKATATLGTCVTDLLALNYPEFEVILVCDAATSSLLDELTRTWNIEARELFYRKTLPTSDVRRIYRSCADPRLVVVDLASSQGYADAMNCGVNIARYRYVASIAPGISFDSEALLRLMTQPLADPGRIVGASQVVERRGGFARLASIRALMETRLVWRTRRLALGGQDVVAVWRRDAVLRCNGFPARAANPALALMFAMQASGHGSRFVRDRGIFGAADAGTPRDRMRAASTRQRGAWRSLGAMLLQRGALRWSTWMAFAHAELCVPLAHLVLLALAVAGAAAGWVTWLGVASLIVLLAFGHAAVTAAALLVRGAAPGAPTELELRRLLFLAPVEFIAARPALALGRLLGTSRR
jgi:hypothetical protein